MIGVAAGYPQRSGIVIPEIWAKRANIKFYDDTYLTEITSNDFAEEIKDVGDVVHIKNTGDVTMRAYTKGADMVIQHVEDTIVDLKIDNAWYYDFACDDIDAHQAAGGNNSLMKDWAADAAHAAAEKTEDIVVNDIDADADAHNVGLTAGKISASYNMGVSGTPFAITSANVIEKIVDARSVLREHSTPRDQLWGLIPEWMAGMLLKSDIKDASLTGDGKSIIRDENGRLGRVAGFTLYETNLLDPVTDGVYTAYNVLFGHKKAVAFAAQMTKIRKIEPYTTFAQLMQGLFVFGYETLKPTALTVLYCRKG
jgi:hypothetical protein